MAVNELLAATIILNEGNPSDSATLPAIPAGSNRAVIVSISMFNGGGNCSLPDTVTSNGKTASFIAGDNAAASQGYAAFGMWLFNESDVASISGQSLDTSTATGTKKSIHVRVLQDCEQAVPSNKNQGRTNAGGTITLPLTRGASSLTIAEAFVEASGSLLTFTNPTRTSSVNYANRFVSVAVAADSAGTSDFTSSTVGGGYENTVAIANFLTASSHGISSIDDPIQAGSSFNFTKFGMGTITSITSNRSGATLSSITNSSATLAGWVNAGFYPELPSTVQFTFGDGTLSANANSNISIPSGYTKVSVASPEIVDTTYFAAAVLAQTGRTIATGDRIYHSVFTKAGGGIDALFSMSADTGISCDSAGGTFTAWLWVSAGADAGKMYQYTATISAGGEVTLSTNILRARAMSISNPIIFNSTPITATTTIKVGQDGVMQGIFVSTATAATITISDGNGVRMPTTVSITNTESYMLYFPVAFLGGLTITITGTFSGSVLWL